MPTPAGPPTRCWRRIGTSWNWQPTTAAANGIGVSFSCTRISRNRWFVVPTGHSVRSRSRSSCRDFMAEPFSDDVAGHPNRTEKRLIFRHNAIPRNDFCTVSPFSSICPDRVGFAPCHRFQAEVKSENCKMQSAESRPANHAYALGRDTQVLHFGLCTLQSSICTDRVGFAARDGETRGLSLPKQSEK